MERIRPELVYDVRNRMLLGDICCHPGHHHPGVNDTRVDYARLPAAALAFAVEVLGEGPAAIYLHRRYRDAPAP